MSYTVRNGLGGKAQLVRNLPCMQIFVIWSQVSWQLIISFLQSPGIQGQNLKPNRFIIYIQKSSFTTVLSVNAAIGF